MRPLITIITTITMYSEQNHYIEENKCEIYLTKIISCSVFFRKKPFSIIGVAWLSSSWASLMRDISVPWTPNNKLSSEKDTESAIVGDRSISSSRESIHVENAGFLRPSVLGGGIENCPMHRRRYRSSNLKTATTSSSGVEEKVVCICLKHWLLCRHVEFL